ncbi:hypothetical protein [Sphingomonas sp. DC2300-3]|uniref:hypothetical protein n=1 Tax=unclassified Sphingomonas TaxID=196159 RepID=UPI003CE7B63C
MAMFGAAMKPRTMPGVVPYFPTPEEQATAIPAQASPLQQRAPRGIFGAPMDPRRGPYNTPGIGDGLQVPANDPPSNMIPAVITGELPQPKIDFSSLAAPVDLSNVQIKKPGFFQHGGVGEKILKGLGEFALRYSASQGDPYAMMVFRNRFEQQQANVRAQEDARRRQQERDEWIWREDYKRAHPDDQFTQYMQAAGIDPRSQQGQALYRQRAESMAAPPLMAVDGYDAQGNQTKTFYPRTAFGGGMGGQPAPAGPAVGTIRNGYRFNGGNPNDRNSWVPVGGASPSGGATFR